MHRNILKTVLALGLSLGLVLPGAVPAAAEHEMEHEGYLVQLREGVRLLSGQETEHLLVVDSLAEAARIPKELVEFIEPNYRVELFETEGPNDPYYGEKQWNLETVHAYAAARAGLTGEGVRIGFVDSGVNGAHEDLDRTRISGMDFIPQEDEEDGVDRDYDQDNMGHGTFVCGLVGAQIDNGVGLAGIAPKAELRVYRVFDKKTTSMAQVVRAVEQAVADGCQILNLSLGSPSRSGALQQAIIKAQQAGVIVVAAVGNSGNATLMYPAALDGVIGVGSVDRTLRKSTYSQYNESVDFTAPAGGVAGLGHTAPDAYRLDLTSSANRGTSFAAPVVTGLIALALGYAPDLTQEQVCDLLAASARDLGETGRDDRFGRGMVDAGALAELLTGTYSITYETAGGTLEQAPDSYTLRDETLVLPVPQRGEDRFLGWYERADCTGTPVTQLPSGSFGDRTFYAGWEAAEPEPLPFTDVEEGDWFAPYVRHVWERGIMAGTGGGQFSPQLPTSRAMAVTMLYQMAGKPEVSGTPSFGDVQPGDWFCDPVAWAVERGVAAGYSPEQFGAEDSITREQLALMLYGFSGRPEGEEIALEHPDADRISPYARTAVEWAVAQNILSGTDRGELLPGGPASRAETAAMFTAFSELN